MIKVIIADDERHSRERLRDLLSGFDNISIVGEAVNGDEVIQMILQFKPDAAVLDINMPGVSVFNTISSLKDAPLIIFQTAYSEYAVDAFGIDAVDYMLKPLSVERVKDAVAKLKKRLTKNDTVQDEVKDSKAEVEKLSVKVGGTMKIISIKDIYKVSSEDGLSFIYTQDGRYLSDKYLNYFEDILKKHDFFRINRNDIVNLKQISTIQPVFQGNYVIELMNKEKIKLSRRRAKDLKKIIDHWSI